MLDNIHFFEFSNEAGDLYYISNLHTPKNSVQNLKPLVIMR